MNDAKLERLRAKYQNAKPGEFFDPVSARIAASQFRGGIRKWPFADPATFLGAPFKPEALGDPDLGGLDIALVGVPLDLGVTNRAGTRLGPRAVRSVERIGPYEYALRTQPMAEARVGDIGDVPMRSRYSLADCHVDIEACVDKITAAGVRPLAIGGDHSMTLPILRSLGRERPVGMVHIDAHADTSGEFEGCKFHHGGPFRQAVLDGVLDPDRTIQIGIRGGGIWLWEFSHESGMTVLHMDEVVALGIPGVIEKAREVVGAGPTYLSFDVDSLDPVFAPGTGTPEIGGFTTREVMELMRGLAGLDIIAGDVVEVAPQYDTTSNTAHAGAQMAFEILCLMVRAPSFKPRP